MKVKLSSITENPYNTREDYGDLTGLMVSIKKFGLTQPLLVRKSPRNEGMYELIIGHRRTKALKELGYEETDIDIRDVNNADMSLMAICENVDRKDLNSVELARAYRKGIAATQMPLNEFAQTIGENHVKIKSYLNILNLPDRILRQQEKYTAAQLTSLAKLNEMSKSLRIELENVLNIAPITSNFLNQIVRSCESVWATGLPSKRKKRICYGIINQDYSRISPRNAADIRTFTDYVLQEELKRYNEILRKTADSLKKAGKARKGIKTVYDIVHWDQMLNRVTDDVRETSMHVDRARKKGYYDKAPEKSRRRFKTAINRLVSGIEEILKNEAEFRESD